MSGFRWQIQASAGPAREGTVGGTAELLVRVRLFDAPGHDLAQGGRPEAFTDLRSAAARELAFELLAAAEHAEHLSTAADQENAR